MLCDELRPAAAQAEPDGVSAGASRCSSGHLREVPGRGLAVRRTRAAGPAPGRRPRGWPDAPRGPATVVAVLVEQVAGRSRSRPASTCTKRSPRGSTAPPPRLRPAGEPVGGVVGDDPAAGQDQHPVGQLLGLVEVMGGEQDRGALQVGESVHQLVELAAGLGVEAGRRLVEEQQLRAADDADRDVEPAALPAGERGDLAVGEFCQPDRVEQLLDVVRAAAARASSTARSSRRAG